MKLAKALLVCLTVALTGIAEGSSTTNNINTAHSGGTDKCGCHTKKKTGEYHCHTRKQRGGDCPA